MSFCSLIKGITPNICWLCFVLINSVPFSSLKKQDEAMLSKVTNTAGRFIGRPFSNPQARFEAKAVKRWRSSSVTPTHPLCEEPQTYTLQGPTGWSAFGPRLTTWFSLSFLPVAVRLSNIRQFFLTLSASATSVSSYWPCPATSVSSCCCCPPQQRPSVLIDAVQQRPSILIDAVQQRPTVLIDAVRPSNVQRRDRGLGQTFSCSTTVWLYCLS